MTSWHQEPAAREVVTPLYPEPTPAPEQTAPVDEPPAVVTEQAEDASHWAGRFNAAEPSVEEPGPDAQQDDASSGEATAEPAAPTADMERLRSLLAETVDAQPASEPEPEPEPEPDVQLTQEPEPTPQPEIAPVPEQAADRAIPPIPGNNTRPVEGDPTLSAADRAFAELKSRREARRKERRASLIEEPAATPVTPAPEPEPEPHPEPTAVEPSKVTALHAQPDEPETPDLAPENSEELLDELRNILSKDEETAAAPAPAPDLTPAPDAPTPLDARRSARPRPTRPGSDPTEVETEAPRRPRRERPAPALSAVSDAETSETAPSFTLAGENPLPRADTNAEEPAANTISRAPLGFAVSVLGFALAFALYVTAPALAGAVPALSGVLEAYVGGVNGLRLGLQNLIG